ncbi:hypothetical protein CTI12_AA575300 [Artemisia annua]|uniref:Uncharacterized protein n=1 Tax=Artemisia annua TaxID=35608 RepID=A0A2U1KQQ9_ARTAN|nr:hypothetical protein CTI12_AA575300 [Artemisia annua]
MYCSAFLKKSNDHGRIVLTAIMGMILGYFLGVSFSHLSFTKIKIHPSFLSPFDMHGDHHECSFPETLGSSNTPELPTIYVPTNPRGA